LAFTDLTRRNEHYRWCHWSIATSYDLILPHCQCHHLPPPPSDNNEDDEDNEDDDDDKDKDNEDEDDSDEDDEGEDDSNNDNDSEVGDDDNNNDEYYNIYYNIHDYNPDGNCKYNYNDLDDNDNDDNDNEYDSNNKYYIHDDANNDDDSDDDDDDEDSNDDEDSDNEDSDDSNDDKAVPDLECLRTQNSIVQRLIVVLGPHFQVSYSPIPCPDFCGITTLQDCIDLPVFCGFRLVDVPLDDILTFLRSDCLLEGFCLSL